MFKKQTLRAAALSAVILTAACSSGRSADDETTDASKTESTATTEVLPPSEQPADTPSDETPPADSTAANTPKRPQDFKDPLEYLKFARERVSPQYRETIDQQIELAKIFASKNTTPSDLKTIVHHSLD
ncbi:MAG: hypothetical protein KDD44_12225, partial [Bdellovibrionales bacterium]|nr:hypothetical protein [Bdellovibrionales bacterium]